MAGEDEYAADGDNMVGTFIEEEARKEAASGLDLGSEPYPGPITPGLEEQMALANGDGTWVDANGNPVNYDGTPIGGGGAYGDNMVDAFREAGGGANTSTDLGRLNLPGYGLGGGVDQQIDSLGASGPGGSSKLDQAIAAAEADPGAYGLGGGVDQQIDSLGASGVLGNQKLDSLAAAAGYDLSDYDLGGGVSEQIDSLGASGALGNQKLDVLMADAGASLTTTALLQEQLADVDDTLPVRQGQVAPPDSKWADAAASAFKELPKAVQAIAAAAADKNNTGIVPPPAPQVQVSQTPAQGVSTNMPKPQPPQPVTGSAQTRPSPQGGAAPGPTPPLVDMTFATPAPSGSAAPILFALFGVLVVGGAVTALAWRKRRSAKKGKT